MDNEDVKYPFSFKWSKDIEAFFIRNSIYLLHPFKIRGIYRKGDTVTFKSPVVVEPFSSMSGRLGFSNCEAFSYLHSAFGSRAQVGRYCSIAPYSRIMGKEHPLDRISTHPFASRDYYWDWLEKRFGVSNTAPSSEIADRGPVVVNDDVWIGNSTLLRPGITIGYGAVIAAGAVVTKDVPPFAVVGGTPAKVIKYRFDEATIARVLDVAWWRYHVRDLVTLDVTDIHGFLDELERRVARGDIKEFAPPKIDLGASIYRLVGASGKSAGSLGSGRSHGALLAASAGKPKQRQRPLFDADINARIIEEIMAGSANDFSKSDYHGRKGDIARNLIGDVALARGWTVESIRRLTYRILTPEGAIIFQQNAPEVAIGSSRLTVDKVATKDLLVSYGVAAPAGRVFTDMKAAAAYFRRCSAAQVVKPAAGGGGYGVTAGIVDDASFVEAWRRATAFGRRVIVEDFVAGDEIRMITVGGKLAAAVCRVPAHVIGDGTRTIKELVAEKNSLRFQNPLLKIYPMKSFDQIELEGRSLSDVPGKGERVRLSTVSNIAMGGESVSVIERLHPSIVAVAEKAAKALPGAILLGLDVMVKDFSADAGDGNVSIIELNSNPAIATLYFAAFGPPASHLPAMLLEHSHRRLKGEEGKVAAPTILPAEAYRASCKGDSFRRDYSTQMRLIRQAAYARNLEVDALTTDLTIVSDEKSRLTFFQGMSDRTRAICRRATNDKEWTKRLLREAGIRTPRGSMFPSGAIEPAWTFAQSLEGPVVVKPMAGSGGVGVATDISTWPHFEQAWEEARATGSKSIIVEEYHRGNDYRILTVGNAICAVAQRIPAHVIGDGKHSIDQLISLRNEVRKQNPYEGSKLVELTPMMQRNLAQQNMGGHTVLKEGQYLQLHTVANIGSGGESADVTESVHPDWAEIAVQVRQVVFDPIHIGFDLIAEDISKAPSDQQWAVIEVNANPDLALHHFITKGMARDVAGALIDALFPSSLAARNAERKSVRILAASPADAEKFAHRIWRHAHLRMLEGSVRALPKQEFELVFSGASNAVDDMVAACAQASKVMSTPSAHQSACDGDIKRGFTILEG